jgi:hypothetical protein
MQEGSSPRWVASIEVRVKARDRLSRRREVPAVEEWSRKTDEPISAPKGASFPHFPMFGLTMRFAAITEGAEGCDFSPHRKPVGEAIPRCGSTLCAC